MWTYLTHVPLSWVLKKKSLTERILIDVVPTRDSIQFLENAKSIKILDSIIHDLVENTETCKSLLFMLRNCKLPLDIDLCINFMILASSVNDKEMIDNIIKSEYWKSLSFEDLHYCLINLDNYIHKCQQKI